MRECATDKNILFIFTQHLTFSHKKRFPQRRAQILIEIEHDEKLSSRRTHDESLAGFSYISTQEAVLEPSKPVVQVEQRSWGLWDLTDKICDAMMQSVKRGQASSLLGPSQHIFANLYLSLTSFLFAPALRWNGFADSRDWRIFAESCGMHLDFSSLRRHVAEFCCRGLWHRSDVAGLTVCSPGVVADHTGMPSQRDRWT